MEEIFSKTLSTTDVGCRLAVPTGSLRHFQIPPEKHKMDLVATDSIGQPWSFCLATRPEGHLKPELRGGWLRFVRQNGLQEGDRVTFYRVNGEIEVRLGPKVFEAHLYPGRR